MNSFLGKLNKLLTINNKLVTLDNIVLGSEVAVLGCATGISAMMLYTSSHKLKLQQSFKNDSNKNIDQYSDIHLCDTKVKYKSEVIY